MNLGEGIEQLGVFVVFAVVSVAFSCVYIFGYRLLKGIFAVIFDALFGIACVFCVVFVNLAVNNGEFRLFVFAGIALGAIIAYFVCKTPLDKAANALYNLFTDKLADKDNGKNVLQQKNVGGVRGGDVAADNTGVHAVGNAHADGVDEPASGRTANSHKKGSGRQRRIGRPFGIQKNRRVRNRLGDSARTAKQRRRFLDTKQRHE